ncbi:MAG: prepilin-type N-terminal cleavage/methylation domain-containing protein [Candidatus Omnitrophica bacterium]|nr:prepilin-type N-terminal cleavage/methylation domain-containing protein [Candidatus Omnitrophota bacterium]
MEQYESFTLVELILVVAIIAILAAVVTPNILSAREDARAAKLVLTIETLKKAALKYYADTGRLPIEGTSYNELSENAAVSSWMWPQPANGQPIPGWNGPYISHVLSANDNPYEGQFYITWWIPGAGDTGYGLLYAWGVPENAAKKVNDVLDKNDAGDWRYTGDVLHYKQSIVLVSDLMIIYFYNIKMK